MQKKVLKPSKDVSARPSKNQMGDGPATLLKIKGKDDFYVENREQPDNKIYFARGPRGTITAVWSDPNITIASFGSLKERRALFARHDRARKRAAAKREARFWRVVKASQS